jgi:hypothetical protein
MDTNTKFWSYLAHFFLEWKNFQKKYYRENKTHILRPVTILLNYAFLWNTVETFCTAGQAPDDMTHAHGILDTSIYKSTLRICNTY